MLIRVRIPLRTIFIRRLVVKTFTVPVHSELLLDTNQNQVNNVLKLPAKHSKLWEINTLISQVN